MNIRGSHVTGAVLVGFVALSAFLVAAVAPNQFQGTASSVHAKNGATPSWILELQTRNARQMPVTVRNGEPSYWI